jgi:hypothetical protein
MPEEHLSDFDHQPWCQEILRSNSIEILPDTRRVPDKGSVVSNSMMGQTLFTDQAIRAFVAFKRKTAEGTPPYDYEYCFLLSIGDGCDGMRGRAHGGFNALIIDHITGVWLIINTGLLNSRLIIARCAPITPSSPIFRRQQQDWR